MTEKARQYADARAFRRALEDRLKQKSKAEGLDLQRLMREVAFARLLARFFLREPAPWVLKGGYALELRIKEARATKDIDLALRETLGKKSGLPLSAAIHEKLAEAASEDIGDFFSFEIGEAMQDLPGGPMAAPASLSSLVSMAGLSSNSISTWEPTTFPSLRST